jgi:WD40 repeat protein
LIAAQAADALAYAHRQKVLHRDVKPSNLLLDLNGTVWVTDFGLAKAEGSDALTQTGDIVGTLRYMAPERFQGSADARSDVYALGLTLYEILTLEPAYSAQERPRLIDKILHAEAPNPRQVDPLIPRDLETITLKATAKAPADRYRTASELAEDLRRYLSDRPILARRASPMERARRWCRRNPDLAVATALAGAALVAATVLAVFYAERQRHFALEQTKATKEKSKLAENLKTSLAESNRRLAVRNFDRAQAAFEKDQIGAGLLWTLESWRAAAAAGDPALEHAARVNLSAWRPYLPRLMAVLPGANAAAFSPDSKFIVISENGGFRRREVKSGRQIGPTIQPPRANNSLVFSHDGKTILIGNHDGTARLWDCATGRPAGPRIRHQGGGSIAVAVSPDGKTFVTYSRDGGVLRLWDAATGRPVGERRLNRREFPSDVASGNRQPSQIWDLASGRYIRPFLKIPMPRGTIALSPDGRTVLTGGTSGTLRLWDAVTGQPLRSIQKGHNDWVRFAIFNPDGETFLTGSTDKTARLWDAVTGRPVSPPLFHQSALGSAAFSPDGKLLITICDDPAVRLWEVEPYQPIQLVLSLGASCTAAAFSPDGKLVVTGDGFGAVRRWDVTSGRFIGPDLKHPRSIGSVVFSRDGTMILIGCSDGTARVWDSATGQPVGPILRHQGQGDVKAVFSPDGKTVLTGGSDATVRRWDMASGAQVGTPFRPAGVVYTLGPDGKTFVAYEIAGSAQSWDLATRSPVGRYGITAVAAFSPDGRSLLTGGIDTVKLWDVPSGTLLLPPLVSQSYVHSLAFRGDGKVLAAGNEQVVHVWDAATGQPIGPILRHPAKVDALAFSPDGSLLLTGCQDGNARLFRAAPEVPDDPDRVALWVEVLTGLTLDPRHGEILILEHTAWLDSRDRLARRGEPPVPARDSLARIEGRPPGLAWTLSQARSDAASEEFGQFSTLVQTAPPHEVAIAYRQVLALGERLVTKYPAEPAYQRGLASTRNLLAWLLATHPDPEFRDSARAVELAGKAVKFDPKNAAYLNTLGTALYRAGDWSGAIRALRQSNERDDGHSGLGHNGYFLAMAHFRRGEFASARVWFEIAGRFHHHWAAADPELIRFRAEAASLLGLGPAADRKDERAPADNATLARLILKADPAAAWAREWLAHSTRALNRRAEQRDDASMPNGPEAFGQP